MITRIDSLDSLHINVIIDILLVFKEFDKLFLAKFDSVDLPRFSDSVAPCRRLLTGKVRYSTRCTACETSKHSEGVLHELDLSVQQYSCLQSALAAYFGSEMLTGDNRYECSKCCCRRDAVRHTAIVELPAVLCVHLLRYEYDRSTQERKKLQKGFTFSGALELEGEEYLLVSVLYHIGTSAYGGHFICEVLDWESGQWWCFDDADVSRTESPAASMPRSHIGASGATTTTNTSEVIDLCGSEVKSGAGANSVAPSEENKAKRKLRDVSAKDPGGSRDGKRGKLGSRESCRKVRLNRQKDAYMLSYVKASAFRSAVELERSLVPEAIRRMVAAEAERHVEHQRFYQLAKDDLLSQIRDRKQLYKSLSDNMSPKGADDPNRFRIVSRDWLQRWVTGDASTFRFPPPTLTFPNAPASIADPSVGAANASAGGAAQPLVTTGVLNDDDDDDDGEVELISKPSDELRPLCKHKLGISIDRIPSMKVISEDCFIRIANCTAFDQVKMVPPFSHADYRCEACFEELVSHRQTLRSQALANSRILALVGGSDGREKVESGYWVSKLFLQQLRLVTGRLMKLDKASGCVAGAVSRTLVDAISTSQQCDAANNKVVQSEGKTAPSESIAISNGKLDSQVNSCLLCVHGFCTSNFQRRATLVAECAWRAITEVFPDAIEVSSAHTNCSQCSSEEFQQQEEAHAHKALHAEERQNHDLAQLHKRRKIYPGLIDKHDCFFITNEGPPAQVPTASALDDSDSVFYAVDGVWMALWRRYMSDSKRPRPPILSNRALVCSHQQALLPDSLLSLAKGEDPACLPCTVLSSRALDDLGTSAMDETLCTGANRTSLPLAELLTVSEWTALKKWHSTPQESGAIEGGDAYATCTTDTSEPQEVALRRRPQAADPNPSDASSCGECLWEWSPACCVECVAATKEREHVARTVYSNVSLKVVILKSEAHLPPLCLSSAVPAASTKESGRTSSATAHGRPTRRSGGKNVTITVDSSDSLSLIKLKLFQAVTWIDFPPVRQKLFNSAGTQMTSLMRTLADYGIVADATLYVVESSKPIQGGDDGIADCFVSHTASTHPQIERGFRGTILCSADSYSVPSVGHACSSTSKEHGACSEEAPTGPPTGDRSLRGVVRAAPAVSANAAADALFEEEMRLAKEISMKERVGKLGRH